MDANTTVPSIPSTIRLSISASFFNASPVRAIKQLIGPNATLLSYTVSSVLTSSDEVIVDATYYSLPITPFSIYYIPISSIRHLIPNSEKYIATVNSHSVKLNNPKLSEFHDYLPVRIKRTMVNTTDIYESYYSTTDDSTFTLNDNASVPIAYFATTVVNPLNYLITPIHPYSTSFNILTPSPLYPSSFVPPKSQYTIDDTINNYKQTVSTIPLLSNISSIEHSTTFPVDSSPIPTTAYVVSASILPSSSIHGVILIQPKRIPDLILYYPTNTFTLSAEELASIKTFIDADIINYNNYYYLKN